MNLFVSITPFNKKNKYFKQIRSLGCNVEFNETGKKITPNLLKKKIVNCDFLVAGTERLTDKVLSTAKNLKLIARAGVGIDSVDQIYLKKRNILLTNVQKGLEYSVAQLIISYILQDLRNLNLHTREIKRGIWKRYIGSNISEKKIGIIGFGNIGQLLTKYLNALGNNKIYLNDISKITQNELSDKNIWATKKFIYKNCDIISLNVDLNPSSRNLINKNTLKLFKKNSILINTSRGEVINEQDLISHLKKNKFFKVYLDVFTEEPLKNSELQSLNNAILTPHIGSMTLKSREIMENSSLKSVIDYIKKD